MFFSAAMASGGALIVIDTALQRVIGSSRFHGYDEAASEVEIGWSFLARSHWGGITNGEVKRLMLRHAFQFVNSVVLFINPDNLRSQRATEKIGGIHVGSSPDSDGQDRLVYRVTAEAHEQAARTAR